mmetsp:Transcript_14471/g.38465  ORF Transcript_14471/g.38465 Transcript_14471/m.38465 type:complete len:279 (+) Transcript_14471:245-1081(+)
MILRSCRRRHQTRWSFWNLEADTGADVGRVTAAAEEEARARAAAALCSSCSSSSDSTVASERPPPSISVKTSMRWPSRRPQLAIVMPVLRRMLSSSNRRRAGSTPFCRAYSSMSVCMVSVGAHGTASTLSSPVHKRRLSGAAPPETAETTPAVQLRGPADLRVAKRASSRQVLERRRKWRRQRPCTRVLSKAKCSASSFGLNSREAFSHASIHETLDGSCSPRVRARSWAIAIARTCTDDGLKPMPRCLSSSSLRVVSTKCSGGSGGASADALGRVRA